MLFGRAVLLPGAGCEDIRLPPTPPGHTTFTAGQPSEYKEGTKQHLEHFDCRAICHSGLGWKRAVASLLGRARSRKYDE